MPEPSLLFVYGTLREGGGNDYLLKGCRRIGKEALVAGNLYLDGGLPMLGKGLQAVLGEVYEIPDEKSWERLDRLEGHPNWYHREKVTVTVKGLKRHGLMDIEAWVYFMNEEWLEAYQNLVRVEHGDYLKARKARSGH
jgi:gamma-glutamylcyclotransferase (GGCT)/AIG2-like uncharacterized protein YtfP